MRFSVSSAYYNPVLQEKEKTLKHTTETGLLSFHPIIYKRIGSHTHHYTHTQGYKLGVAATLALWVVWDCVVQVAKFGKPTIVAKMGFPVFRGTQLSFFLPVACFHVTGWEGVETNEKGQKAYGRANICMQVVSINVSYMHASHHHPIPLHAQTAVGGLLLLHWCWGILENVCNYLRINFVYLLDLSPKNVYSPR